MTDLSVEQEALTKLMEMGVDKEKAQEALLKYNNDVNRAADSLYSTSDSIGNWNTPTPHNDSDYNYKSERNDMALVLYQNENKSQDNNWGEQPIKRVKLDDTTPLGLKPVTDHGFAGSFFQALFHIPIFRLAILAYRPTRDDWGEDYSNNYQKDRSRSHTLKFMHEFQKLFGFLSMSQRVYGDANSLMEALNFEINWGCDVNVSAREFVNKLLDLIVHSFSFRDLIDLDSGTLSEHIIPFDMLLRSLGRNENSRGQSKKGDEDVLCIPLEITSSCNTVYAAIDQIVREQQNVFFVELAKILILSLKHHDGFADNSFISGDLAFHIDKELYMDRYLLDRAKDIEKRWHQLECLKSEFEKVNQDIRKITDYQGRHSGLDLLKGSINYFRRKCDKARNFDDMDDSAQESCFFLERVLEQVEYKLKDLIEKKEEIEAKIRDIFDTPDMKRVVYRLKAVLGFDGQQFGQRFHAYIWVSKGNKTEIISSNSENGNWWKFCDETVEQVVEEQVLKDMSGNSGVYSLIYVNSDVDYNFSNINDLIPSLLKEYVKKDNNMLDDEAHRNQDYATYFEDHNTTANQDVPMDNYEISRANDTYNSDSTVYGSSKNDYHNQSDSRETKIECEFDAIIKQEENMISLHPQINTRFEVFCVKLNQTDLLKSLMFSSYYNTSHVSVDWSEPLPLNTKYQDDPQFKEYVELFIKYKEITLYFTEGLDRICADEYKNALPYFKYAINLENDWIENIEDLRSRGKSISGEKLQRSKEIDAYARACLKLEHECFLGKIRSKPYVTLGLKDGLLTLSNIVRYIGASNCARDELFKQFKIGFEELLNNDFNDEQEGLIQILTKEYEQPKECLELKPIEPIESISDGDLYERYRTALKESSKSLKKYDVPDVSYI